jgi:hypothetical protein
MDDFRNIARSIAADRNLGPEDRQRLVEIAGRWGSLDLPTIDAEVASALTKRDALAGFLGVLAEGVKEERILAELPPAQRDAFLTADHRDTVASGADLEEGNVADPATAELLARMAAAEERDKARQNAIRREVSLVSKIAELRSREGAHPHFAAERLRLEAELADLRGTGRLAPPAEGPELMRRAMAEARAELALEGE